MSRIREIRFWAGAGIFCLALAIFTMPGTPPQIQAQQPARDEIPDALRFVPVDAALFAFADVPKIWDSEIVKNVRKADPKTLEFLTSEAKKELGIVPENLKSVVFFVPKLKGPGDTESFGIVLSFNKPFDKALLQKGAETLLPKRAKPKVIAHDAQTAVVLLNLKEAEFGKPQPSKTGPLTESIKAAASGKYAAVAAATLASLPEEIRGDDVPAPFRAFQPLFKSITISGTLELDRNATLNVRVKTGTAGQAIDCEKSLGVLLALVQDEIDKGMKEFEKDASLKDMVALLKAVATAAKGTKFDTLGNETKMTVSMPSDLPYGSAFVALRKKIQDGAALQTSANNLKQIGIAMHNYLSVNDNFPPAAVCDKTGKPMLSWRVLILPYVDENELYKQFKLDEPWDSENNKKLLAKMPKVYAIPGRTQPGDTNTHYRVFVGNGAGFDYLMGTKIAHIADGTSNTFLCVTAAEAVPWTKPDELAFDPDKDMGKLIGMIVNGRAQVALFDGSVRTLKAIPKKETLNALITKNGGEVIADFE